MSKQAISKFSGFTPRAKQFFSDLKANNNKEWFENNRHIYEECIKEPSRALVQEMALLFAEKGLPFVADPKRSLFRINRDTRFSANKDPYKTNLGVFFPFSINQAGQKPINALGLYFHFDTDETFIAGGLHSPEPDILRAIRQRIAEDWGTLKGIVENKKFRKYFSSILEGESLKRVPPGYPKDHPAERLLRLKQYLVWKNMEYSEAQGRNLISILEESAMIIAPFLEYFQDAAEANL